MHFSLNTRATQQCSNFAPFPCSIVSKNVFSSVEFYCTDHKRRVNATTKSKTKKRTERKKTNSTAKREKRELGVNIDAQEAGTTSISIPDTDRLPAETHEESFCPFPLIRMAGKKLLVAAVNFTTIAYHCVIPMVRFQC